MKTEYRVVLSHKYGEYGPYYFYCDTYQAAQLFMRQAVKDLLPGYVYNSSPQIWLRGLQVRQVSDWGMEYTVTS